MTHLNLYAATCTDSHGIERVIVLYASDEQDARESIQDTHGSVTITALTLLDLTVGVQQVVYERQM